MKNGTLRLIPVFALGLGVLAAPAAHAAGETDSGTQTVTATVSSYAKLTISQGTVTFQNEAPNVSSISQTEGPATVSFDARTSTGGSVILKIKATDLTNAENDTISADQLSWVGTGNIAATGTLSNTDQNLYSDVNSGSRSGSIEFKLANALDRATGTYTGTITYTLLVD